MAKRQITTVVVDEQLREDTESIRGLVGPELSVSVSFLMRAGIAALARLPKERLLEALKERAASEWARSA